MKYLLLSLLLTSCFYRSPHTKFQKGDFVKDGFDRVYIVNNNYRALMGYPDSSYEIVHIDTNGVFIYTQMPQSKLEIAK